MKNVQLTVIGHYGLSLIFDVIRFPAVGETVCALNAETEKGGKGFNQAYGAVRLGSKVQFITAVGDDEVGESCENNLKRMDFGGGSPYVIKIRQKMTACGVAINSADKGSEVVVFSGAIMSLKKGDIRRYKEQIASSDLLLVQNEIPPIVLEEAVMIAREAGVKVLYNPAPAVKVPSSVYENVYCITPNETEAALLTGADVSQPLDLGGAFDALHKMGARNIVITLGSAGAAVSTADGTRYRVDPLDVEVINTTGAGDSFNAAFAVALAEGKEIAEAVVFATAASGLSVSRHGICESMPFRDDVEKVLSSTSINIHK